MQIAPTITQTQPAIVFLPGVSFETSRYVVRFATSVDEVEAALKLRFEVFNLELGEGLDSSFLTGRDRDEFDATCRHLIVIDKDTDAVVGTYRVRTFEMAQKISGFYSAGEFDLQSLPPDVLWQSVEVGRACIARQHRGKQVLTLLWRALAHYTQAENKRYLFGCCSLTSQEPAEGQKLMQQLSEAGYMHPRFWVKPHAHLECAATAAQWPGEVQLPRLFKTYLGIGAQVCGPPAIDRQFKTIDFFVMFDLRNMNERMRRMFIL